MSDIFFSPIESLSDFTFISTLLASEKLTKPVFPWPGTPKRPPGNIEYFLCWRWPWRSVYSYWP